MIRLNHNRDCLMFYELIEEAESKEELEATIENLIDSFREGISDFCADKGWDIDDVESEIL